MTVTPQAMAAGLLELAELPNAPERSAYFGRRLMEKLVEVGATDRDFLAVCKRMNRDEKFHPTTGQIAKAITEYRVERAREERASEWGQRALPGPGARPAFGSDGRDRNGLTPTEAMNWIESLVARGHGGETGPQRERYADAIAREKQSRERPRYGPDLRAFRGKGGLLARAMAAKQPAPVCGDEDQIERDYGREARDA